ncbi:hypothetical protein AVEN_205658-1 [Araneus ventricosus]|uniref:Uncharacterized protein n=1 Tax=Araneus ventricosus TaxID=182803 RepID=A0A4Y2PP45_ARAVE|nr:hypothetical protein AVEN_205658-1 [Araneus ventricosus]
MAVTVSRLVSFDRVLRDEKSAGWCASTLEESEFLNNATPNRWIGRAGTNDKVTSPWPLQVTVHYPMRRSCGDLRKTKWMCHNCHATSRTSETRIGNAQSLATPESLNDCVKKWTIVWMIMIIYFIGRRSSFGQSAPYTRCSTTRDKIRLQKKKSTQRNENKMYVTSWKTEAS